jgi:hypothetical protein
MGRWLGHIVQSKELRWGEGELTWAHDTKELGCVESLQGKYHISSK